jgi:WS/DGAT/MGAT family acyltransferase
MFSETTPAKLPRKKMSPVDHAWLRMDSDGNLMMIVGVAMLDQPVSVAALKQELQQHFLVYRRFRSKVVQQGGAAWWQEVPVDLDQHLICRDLPPPASGQGDNKAALERLVGQLAGQALDPELPLWQMHLIGPCIGADGHERQALVVRIHHCIADGVSLVGLFMSMFGASADGNLSFVADETHHALHEVNPWQEVLAPVTRTSIAAIESSSAMLSKYLELLGEADHMGAHVQEWGHTCAQLAHDVLAISTMASDSQTRFKGRPCGEKRVAWSEPLPLEEVKTMARAYDCSINDILMASVAGALRGYLSYKGDFVSEDCELRAMVPVNLRKLDEAQKLGNEFGLVPLVLPIGMENPLERLQEVKRRMAELKGSYTALVAMSMLAVLGVTPKTVQTEVQDFFAKKASAVMSNVPGPRAPLYMAGAKLDQVMFWVPQSGDIGVGISILSYNGAVQFGIVTDVALIDDPEQVIARFAPEFEKLVLLMLMEGQW